MKNSLPTHLLIFTLTRFLFFCVFSLSRIFLSFSFSHCFSFLFFFFVQNLSFLLFWVNHFAHLPQPFLVFDSIHAVFCLFTYPLSFSIISLSIYDSFTVLCSVSSLRSIYTLLLLCSPDPFRTDDHVSPQAPTLSPLSSFFSPFANVAAPCSFIDSHKLVR